MQMMDPRQLNDVEISGNGTKSVGQIIVQRPHESHVPSNQISFHFPFISCSIFSFEKFLAILLQNENVGVTTFFFLSKTWPAVDI